MTKWWKVQKEMGARWYKVESYSPCVSFDGALYEIAGRNRNKEWFIDKDSADIPPEEER